MVDVKSLFEYNEEVRHRYFKTLTRLPWEEVVKNREASHHSFRNIFVHTLNALDNWLDVLQNVKMRIQRKFDEYDDIEDVRRYMEHVETRLQKYIASLTQGELRRMLRYGARDISVEDVLIHLFEEEVHHRGELIALLWQMGVEPPRMGWKNI